MIFGFRSCTVKFSCQKNFLACLCETHNSEQDHSLKKYFYDLYTQQELQLYIQVWHICLPYHYIYIYIYIAKIDGLELVKRQFFQRFLAVAFFKGILLIHHQVVNSTDLRDVKYIFKLDEVILDLSSTRLFQTSQF